MGRLALQPRYVEVDHLLNGDMESWSVATQPDSWTLNGGANGTANRDTANVFSGAASARIDKTASGAIYLSQVPKRPLTPSLYYALRGAVSASAPLPANRVFCRLVNITKNQTLLTDGTWANGLSNSWLASVGARYVRAAVWFRVPATFAESDAVELRVGMFNGGTGVSAWVDGVSLIGPYVRPINKVGLAALTYAALARREIVVVLSGPTGLEIDITRRVKLDGIGRITEGAEEELLQLTHGDMTLTLDDRDEMIRGLLDDASATDRWELVILTETGRARGLKWDRLFAGVLDLPWSVSFDPKDRETKIQVFSYTKALDLVSATALGRSVMGRTFTISAGSKNATTNSTTDLMRGDIITARSGSTNEQFIIDRVDSPTAFRVKVAAQNAFTAADLTLDTYFHREKTAAYLASAICDAASVRSRTISLTSDLAAFPVAQPIAAHGLGIVTHPVSLVQQTGKIVATFLAADETKRKQTTGPTSAWTDGATSNTPQGDWRPYLTSEPGTIKESTLGGTVDDGRMAWDHTAGSVYYGQHQNSGSPAFLNTIHLFRDGVDLGSIGGGAADPDDVDLVGIDWDPVNSRCWTSTSNSLGSRRVGYYDGAHNLFDGTRSGQLRCCRPINRLVLLDDVTGKLRFYNLTGLALDREISPPPGTVILWTLRAWDSILAYMLTRADGTYVAVHDATTLAQLAVYRVSSKIATAFINAAFLTVFTLGDGRNVAVGYAGEEWFVLSRRLDGVVAYADFTGLSCAGALKELAIASLAYLDADRYNAISLVQRPVASSVVPVQTLEDPLDRTSRPIWEFYRTACKVTGTDSLGNDFEVIQGVDGGSAKALEVSSPLVSTPGMAAAVALFYAAYLNRVVRQEDLRIDEPEEPVRVLDIVSFDDRKWLVTEVQSNTRDREQSVRLFEVR